MGRFFGFLAEFVAAVRAIAEVVALVGGRARSRAAGAGDVADRVPPPGEPVVAPVDQPPGPAVGEPQVRGPQAGLTDPS